MKKLFYFFVLVILTSRFGSQAQELNFGVVAGYNLDNPSNDNGKSGFHVGAKGELTFPKINDGLYLDFGLLYSIHQWKSAAYNYVDGTNDETFEFLYKPGYLNIPVRIGYKLSLNDKIRLFANVGPYANIGLHGKTQKTTFKSGKESKESYKAFSKNGMERLDFGIGTRLGLELQKHYQISIGYDHGFKNTYKKSLIENKNRTWLVSAAYVF